MGQIEGDDLSVQGPIRVEVVNGRTTAVLASGSEVTVRAGQARLALTDGGEIGICGPAHFSVLKSGGAVTLAFDYGTVHARLATTGTLTIYTPLVVATPVAIGDGPREATVGLQASGQMCVHAARGAVRVEQQLGGQSLLVPQGGEIRVDGGGLGTVRGTEDTCQCELLSARRMIPPVEKPPVLSALAVPLGTQSRDAKPLVPPQVPAKPEVAEKNAPPPILTDRPAQPGKSGPPATEEPIYKVFMPPLTFDASAPTPPPDPDPQTILLLRSVRVRPAVVYRGHVQAAPPSPAQAPPVQVAQVIPPRMDEPPKSQPGVFTRM